MTESLYEKYRPTSFKQVVGQPAIVRSLQMVLDKGTNRTVMLVGPSGTGKTTLARIAASVLGFQTQEIDAATHTGIDAMRDVMTALKYKPLDSTKGKVLIIDECFAAGTLVDTPTGPRPIEQLVVGDFVLGVFGKARIKDTMVRAVPHARVVWLTLQNGQTIQCSQDHPFLTTSGWCYAGELDGKNIICEASAVPPYLQKVWDWLYEHRSRRAILPSLQNKDVPGMWRKVSRVVGYVRDYLWESIGGHEAHRPAFGRMASSYSGRAAPQRRSQPCFVEKIGASQFQAHEVKKSYAHVWGGGQDESRQSGAGFLARLERSEGWQRSWTYCCAEFIASTYWWCFRIGNSYRQTASWLAALLQGRYWVSGYMPWYRGGRQRSPAPSRAQAGSVKGFKVTQVRVDRGALYQRAGNNQFEQSAGQSKTHNFYDLEIEGHPSFSVHGMLVHNCQRLSGQAWDSMLKVLEEPPLWVRFFLCTTDPAKIPKAVQTRCTPYTLKPVSDDELFNLLDKIAGKESILTDDSDGKIISLCARKADGSPRQALVNLTACASAKTLEEARELLLTVDIENAEAVDLAKALIGNKKWPQIQEILVKLKDKPAESVRHVVRAYATAVIINNGTGKNIEGPLAVLEAFSKPFSSTDQSSPLVLAVGELLFGN